MRLSLALAALAALVGGCGAPPSSLTFEETQAAVDQALRAGDGERAVDLLRESGASGHFWAYGHLAEAYDRGYFTVRDSTGGSGQNVAIRTWPWQAPLADLTFKRHLDRAARAGDPEALLAQARKGSESIQIENGKLVEVEMTPAKRASATAIYRQLVSTDVDRLRLALLAQALGDDEGYRQHVTEAAAQGDPTACDFKIWFLEDDPLIRSPHVAGVAAYYDRVADCAPDRPIPYKAQRSLRALRDQIALGNPASAAVLDSLRQSGVFVRHPELAPIFDRPS